MAITVMVLCSVLAGLANSIIWVAEGEFVSLCATNSTRGFYFGLTGAFFVSSQIIGNLIGSRLIEETSGPVFFLVLGCIGLLSLIGLSTLTIP